MKRICKNCKHLEQKISPYKLGEKYDICGYKDIFTRKNSSCGFYVAKDGGKK